MHVPADLAAKIDGSSNNSALDMLAARASAIAAASDIETAPRNHKRARINSSTDIEPVPPRPDGSAAPVDYRHVIAWLRTESVES